MVVLIAGSLTAIRFLNYEWLAGYLLHELGYQADDNILDILHHPVYLCGFLNGYEKTTKYKSRLESLENKTDQYSKISKELKSENQKLKNEISSLKEAEDETRAQLSESEYMYNNIQQMYAGSQAENRCLRIANEELVQGLSDIEEPSECHKNDFLEG